MPDEPKGAVGTFEIRGGKNELVEQLLAKTGPLPKGMTMNQLGLLFAAQTVEIQGVILGSSSVGQLSESLEFGKTAHERAQISFS